MILCKPGLQHSLGCVLIIFHVIPPSHCEPRKRASPALFFSVSPAPSRVLGTRGTRYLLVKRMDG